MKGILRPALLSACLAMITPTGIAWAAGDGWLRGADDDAARFERLEQYLGGFSRSMWEVGERYTRIHEALELGNFALARYHWEKIAATIEDGYLKRPARRANSDAMLLNTVWPEVDAKLASGDPDQAWAGFADARAACMACHVAENVPFMNEQPIFRNLLPPKTD